MKHHRSVLRTSYFILPTIDPPPPPLYRLLLGINRWTTGLSSVAEAIPVSLCSGLEFATDDGTAYAAIPGCSSGRWTEPRRSATAASWHGQGKRLIECLRHISHCSDPCSQLASYSSHGPAETAVAQVQSHHRSSDHVPQLARMMHRTPNAPHIAPPTSSHSFLTSISTSRPTGDEALPSGPGL